MNDNTTFLTTVGELWKFARGNETENLKVALMKISKSTYNPSLTIISAGPKPLVDRKIHAGIYTLDALVPL